MMFSPITALLRTTGIMRTQNQAQVAEQVELMRRREYSGPWFALGTTILLLGGVMLVWIIVLGFLRS